LARDLKDQEQISTLLEGLGVLSEQQGDDLHAEEYFLESLTIAQERGHTERILSLLTNLSAVKGNQGNYTKMKDYLEQGLNLANKTEHRLYESAILCSFGFLYLKQQKIECASTAFLKSLEIAKEAGIPEQMANAMYYLARVAAAKCNPFEMNDWGLKSLAIFQSIGHHRARDVRQWLNIYNSTISSYLSEKYHDGY
jgi:tetratricopeptide (TPR) repeat protein